MDHEFKAALFALAFHAKLSQSGRLENGVARCSPAEHEIIVADACDAAEKGAAEFERRFPEQA